MGPCPRHATTRSSRSSIWVLDSARRPAARAASRRVRVRTARGAPRRSDTASATDAPPSPESRSSATRAAPVSSRAQAVRASSSCAHRAAVRASAGTGSTPRAEARAGIARWRRAERRSGVPSAARHGPSTSFVYRDEARLFARRLRVRSPQPEQRTQPCHPVVVARDRGDSAQGRGAGATRQAQQHRLSLVVHRVPEEDRSVFSQPDRSQGGPPGLPGRPPPRSRRGLARPGRPPGQRPREPPRRCPRARHDRQSP